MRTPPVALFARPVGSAPDTEMRRLVVRADARAQFDALPVGVPASDSSPITLLPDARLSVLDLVTGEVVTIRRASCGLPLCACAAEWWSEGLDIVPPPSMFDDLAFYEEPCDGE
jgi:hypothetical protein